MNKKFKSKWKKFWHKPNPEGVRGIDVMQVYIFAIVFMVVIYFILEYLK